ncbi:hypothetical protein RJ641_007027 [Dillenia turbinata]|uniref:Uncharacterized protein n=1 Tax=Dillenia turbinata TaxID=194707 RepID=A0AAN8VEK1_9MAGN
MLSVLSVHLPSDIPIVGYELTPYVLLRQLDKTVTTDDVPESSPLDGESKLGIATKEPWVAHALIFHQLADAAHVSAHVKDTRLRENAKIDEVKAFDANEALIVTIAKQEVKKPQAKVVEID